MGWFDWYLQLFEGEPPWLVVLVSIVLVAGVAVIIERLLKWGIWLLVIGLVGGVALLVGGFFFYY